MLENNRLEGGLQTKGIFDKKSQLDKPLVSIITVCLNSEKYLEQTIQSVINQSYDNIEYIIIDGGSTDGTLDIIRKYENRIAYWVSEPDQGIYDAMNKGSINASGDYALYINAGDYLYCDNSIETSLRLGLRTEKYPFLIAGRVRFALDDQLLDWVLPINENKMYKYHPQHQAVFISKSIYKKVFYNPLLGLAGDNDFWVRLRRQGLFQAKYIDSIISVFRLGGVSNSGRMQYSKYIEHEIIRYIHSKKFSILRLLKGAILATIKKAFVSILGENIYYRYILRGVYLFRKKVL